MIMKRNFEVYAFQITSTKEIDSEDIFTLEKVNEALFGDATCSYIPLQVDNEVVKNYSIVASITAVLTSQIQKVS